MCGWVCFRGSVLGTCQTRNAAFRSRHIPVCVGRERARGGERKRESERKSKRESERGSERIRMRERECVCVKERVLRPRLTRNAAFGSRYIPAW